MSADENFTKLVAWSMAAENRQFMISGRNAMYLGEEGEACVVMEWLVEATYEELVKTRCDEMIARSVNSAETLSAALELAVASLPPELEPT